MTQRPIGVFDSGLGGLTAVRELHSILPNEDIVYFGDTGRVPYGGRGRHTIIAYTRQNIAFLLQKNVKALLAACGTISSTYPASEAARLPVPYMGVVEAAAQKAAQSTKNNRVGIIGTQATVASGIYERHLARLLPNVSCTSAACPLFVPLVENGHFALKDPMVALAIEEYLPQVKAAGVDTVILGCTHYPLMKEAIGAFFGADVELIDTGRQAALCLKDSLAQRGLLRTQPHRAHTQYYVSDEPARFGQYARLFLGHMVGESVERINIEEFKLELE